MSVPRTNGHEAQALARKLGALRTAYRQLQAAHAVTLAASDVMATRHVDYDRRMAVLHADALRRGLAAHAETRRGARRLAGAAFLLGLTVGLLVRSLA